MSITKVEKLMRNGERLIDSLRCTINGRVCFVPENPGNADYADILRLNKAGEIKIEEIEV